MVITRSRIAALKSTAKPSTSSTSKQNNNNGPDDCINRDGNYGLNGGLRRSTRKLTGIGTDTFTGFIDKPKLKPILSNGNNNNNINTIEDIVRDVVADIVDYVSKPGLKELISTTTVSNDPTTSTSLLSSNYLYCNKKSIHSLNHHQPSSSSLSTNYDGELNHVQYEDDYDVNRVEAITCEVALDVDMSEDTGRCPVCGLYGELTFEGYLGDKLDKVCSKLCVDKLRIKDKDSCSCSSCDKSISLDSQGYLANFGPERSTLCSEECLLKFEKDNEPAQNCFSCKKEIILQDGISIFYWQTMEFCSPECIENLQKSWGRRCANCDAPVPHQSLGKYSVRFGNVIKQFCHGSCLEQYKKAVKVCAYCQVKLSGCLATCTSVTGGSSTKRIREFCDPVCRSHYMQMVSIRNSSTSNNNGESAFSSPAVQCCQCSRLVEKSNCLDVMFRGKKYIICSSFCLSAFKYSFDVTKLICESCAKYGWPSQGTNILHYSGFTKLFCSRKCLQMHVLKIRRIQSCLTCNVKKYNFDLVEKYELTSGDSKLFCSTFCYGEFEQFESHNEGKELQSFCDWCRQLARLQYHIPSPEKTVRNFCSYSCVLASQCQESNDGSYDNMTQSRSTIESTFKPSSGYNLTSFNYLASPVNTINSDANSVPSCMSELVRSTGFPSSSPSTSSTTHTPLPYRSSQFSSTSTFATCPSTRSTRSLQDGIDVGTLPTISSHRPGTHYDQNLSTQSTLPYACFNNVDQIIKDETRSAIDTLPPPMLTTAQSYKSLGISSPYSLENSSMAPVNVADKSTMWHPSRRSKATLCRPSRRDRHSQTDIQSLSSPSLDAETERTDCALDKTSDGRSLKCIPVPIFVPFFIPVPIPIPMGSASLLPLPLPTPVPFGFPIDSRLTAKNLNESTSCNDIDTVKIDDQSVNDINQQSDPSTEPKEASKETNSKDTNRKKPKNINRIPTNSIDGDEMALNSDSDSEYEHSNTVTNKSKRVKSDKLKRNGRDLSTNNNDNYCDDSDTCSNASSSDDREKTKRRRVTIPTHG